MIYLHRLISLEYRYFYSHCRFSAWNGEFGGSADVYVGVDRPEEIAEIERKILRAL
ncbi:MAG: hypothetical protein WC748_04770 [Legionellales bacterium]|jgi:hypothetical protein